MPQHAPEAAPPDLFDAEHQALQAAREVHRAHGGADDRAPCHQALGELLSAYERLLRETRRLVRRSDRAELEMNQLNMRLQDLAAQLEFRANHDPLTGVLNRAAIIEQVNRRLRGGGLALIVLDIDFFKRVNDSFGHPVGDRVILGVVDCLKAVVPRCAQVGRVGGEEFTVVLPGLGLADALPVADALRCAIEAHPFALPDASRITASFGLCVAEAGSDFDCAYGRADEALYAAKRGGRNRVCIAEGVTLAPLAACA
ncbi:GGDEF domain-containing protein [Acidovorax sp. Leaf160]|uniref:GGDEF domain-containing protein n=1 Tax=Acidovorax sp. Leaf160 TaxID=1736280 RepID=UPI0006F935B7|nr:GGDEF domain-containing protein [Acidovorax sp. Leaf160]KQR60277.1 diguanylate cyclase [Acidovorax sp. Leaf160]